MLLLNLYAVHCISMHAQYTHISIFPSHSESMQIRDSKTGQKRLNCQNRTRWTVKVSMVVWWCLYLGVCVSVSCKCAFRQFGRLVGRSYVSVCICMCMFTSFDACTMYYSRAVTALARYFIFSLIHSGVFRIWDVYGVLCSALLLMIHAHTHTSKNGEMVVPMKRKTPPTQLCVCLFQFVCMCVGWCGGILLICTRHSPYLCERYTHRALNIRV